MTRRVLAAVIGMLLLHIAAFSGEALAQGGTWTTKAPMPTARFGAAAGVIADKLYVAGGCPSSCLSYPYTRSTVLEVYDPLTDTWTTGNAPIPTAVYGAATGVIDGKLYVAGGHPDFPPNSATLQVYDPTTDAWTIKAPLPSGTGGSASGVIGGKLYVVGGLDPSNASYTDTLRIYDPATDSWSLGAPIPGARTYAGAGVIGGKLYVVGGFNGSYLNTLEVYDPMTNTWTSGASMPTARYFFAAQVVDGILYAIGGTNGTFLDVVEAYDPATDTWTTANPMPSARQAPSSGAVQGVIYVIGGISVPVNTVTAVNEAFTPAPPCTGPTITDLHAQPNILWPPNHKMVPVTVSGTTSGGCGAVSCQIINVTSNEPAGLGVDWVITGPLTVDLRAERLGKGSGRTYTITVQCTDSQGNSTTRTVTVTVPHDQGH